MFGRIGVSAALASVVCTLSASAAPTCFSDGWCENVDQAAGVPYSSFWIWRTAFVPKLERNVALAFFCNRLGREHPPWTIGLLGALSHDGDTLNLQVTANDELLTFNVPLAVGGPIIEAAEHREREVTAMATATDDAIATVSTGQGVAFSFTTASFKSHYRRAIKFCVGRVAHLSLYGGSQIT